MEQTITDYYNTFYYKKNANEKNDYQNESDVLLCQDVSCK